MIKTLGFIGVFLFAAIVIVLQSFHSRALVTADKIFINGRVLTMDNTNSIVQALAVKDGKILAVGTTTTIEKLKGSGTEVIDLANKTMLPGLIDGHSHIMGLGAKFASLAPPPVGMVKSVADIITTLQDFKKQQNIKDGEWITGFGYDQDQMIEKRHPVKEDLDSAFPNNPVVISHISGHMVVANAAALKASAIDNNTKDPAGGVIVRKPGTSEPAGLLQETAAALLKRPAPNLTLQQKLASLKEMQLLYASFGVTTAQDGYSNTESLALLKAASDRQELLIDIEALAGYALIDSLINTHFSFGTMNNHFKVAGFKMVADGSPQGKTAFFSKPYLTAVPGCNHELCTGIPTVTQQQFDEAVIKGYKNNIRIFVHCNGDATVDMYIKSIEKANKQLNTIARDRRPVVIHSQFVRADQLDKYKELGMMPAFFTNHAYFWGDVHVQNLGKERAYFLSPLKSVLDKKIMFTNHTDYPVTPINQMFLLWTSVVRQSRSGQVIGTDERLTPMEGLRAITINGAYEYAEEKIKGSLEKGKLADLIILSDDPIKTDPAKIKEIVVLETIKEGKTIYKSK